MIYGEQLRISGARPITRPPETLEVRDRQEHWDPRFWLGKIPSYNSARDPHVKYRRPQSLTTPLFRVSSSRGFTRSSNRLLRRDSNPSVPTLIRSASKPLFSQTDSGLAEMRRDLEATWDKEGVPVFHREAYRRHLDRLNWQSAAVEISKELTDLQQRKTPVQSALSLIDKRESLLEQIVGLEEDMEDERLLQLDLRDLLQQLQRVNVDLVESVGRWRELAGVQAAFQWKGDNYLQKMKRDLARLAQGPLARFLPGIVDDPMLVRTLGRGDRRQGSSILSRQRSRAQDAELVLVQEPEPLLPPSPPPVSVPLSASTPLDHSISSSSFPLVSQQTLDLAKLLGLDLLSEILNEWAHGICYEAGLEIQAAHLLLHSNKILDGVITRALEEQIPICAQESYTEEIDREFISLQKQILEAVIVKEVKEGVELWALEVVAEEITREFAAIVEVRDIVEDSVKEETILNQQMIADIFQRLIDSHMSEEWLEIMCEDVLSDEILNTRLDELPIAVLKQVLKENPQKHKEKMAEHCYFLLLYQYVGDLWLKRVCEEAIHESRGVHVFLDTFQVSSEKKGRRVTHYFQ